MKHANRDINKEVDMSNEISLRDETISQASLVAKRIHERGSAGLSGDEIHALARGFAAYALEDVLRSQRPVPSNLWVCKARLGNPGANDPQDCNWPLCGCDPHADRVIEKLNEVNLYVVPGDAAEAMIDAAVEWDLRVMGQELAREHYADLYQVMVERSQKS